VLYGDGGRGSDIKERVEYGPPILKKTSFIKNIFRNQLFRNQYTFVLHRKLSKRLAVYGVLACTFHFTVSSALSSFTTELIHRYKSITYTSP